MNISFPTYFLFKNLVFLMSFLTHTAKLLVGGQEQIIFCHFFVLIPGKCCTVPTQWWRKNLYCDLLTKTNGLNNLKKKKVLLHWKFFMILFLSHDWKGAWGSVEGRRSVPLCL